VDVLDVEGVCAPEADVHHSGPVISITSLHHNLTPATRTLEGRM
jgi:hypothetical protein